MTGIDLVSYLFGAGFSWVLKTWPVFAVWFYKPENKNIRPWVVIGGTLVIALILFGLSCFSFENTFVCTQKGFYDMLKLWGESILSSQLFYLLSPGSKYKADKVTPV